MSLGLLGLVAKAVAIAAVLTVAMMLTVSGIRIVRRGWNRYPEIRPGYVRMALITSLVWPASVWLVWSLLAL